MNAKFILKLGLIILFLFSPQNASADTYDDFNDGVINTDKWGIFDYWYLEGQSDNTTPAVPVYEANGSLNIDYPPGSSYGGVRSKALFGGDFDFRTEWNWQYDGVPSTYEDYVAQIGINVRYDDSSDNSTRIFRGWESTFPEGYHDVYMSYAYVDGTWHSGTGNITTPTDTSGYLGIERIGSTINTYYSDINHQNYENWNLLNQVDNAFTKPVSLNLTAYTGDNTNSFHAEWDNVEIEADKIIVQDGLFSKEEKEQLKDWGKNIGEASLEESIVLGATTIVQGLIIGGVPGGGVAAIGVASTIAIQSFLTSKAFEWIIDHDPPYPGFDIVQEPLFRNPEDFLYYELSDQELKDRFLELMDVKLKAFGYLEAAFTAENKYSGALEAGDWDSAELQKDAFWEYLSSGLSILDNSYSDEVGFMEYLQSNYNFTLTQEDFDIYLGHIESYGLPQDTLDLFEQLGFDEEWQSEYLNFAQTFSFDLPTDFNEVNERYLSGIKNWENIHGAPVPEPSSLSLLFMSLFSLYVIGRKRKNHK